MQRYFLSISFCLLCLLNVASQNVYPSLEGQKARYDVKIDFGKAYISGLCMLANTEGEIRGSVFNEFGISAMSFVYRPEVKKVKLVSLLGMIDKWYIRKVLRKDLCELMKVLEQGESQYEDKKYGLKFDFQPIINKEKGNNEVTE